MYISGVIQTTMQRFTITLDVHERWIQDGFDPTKCETFEELAPYLDSLAGWTEPGEVKVTVRAGSHKPTKQETAQLEAEG